MSIRVRCGTAQTEERRALAFAAGDGITISVHDGDAAEVTISADAAEAGLTQADLDAHTADATAVHGIADTAQLVLTGDARLSDARTPTAHTHPISDVTSLQASLDGKAASAHTHDDRYYTEAEVDALLAAQGGVTLEDVYPVGSIYISVVATSPATLFGFGTWAAFAAGRTLVGRDAGDADFDTAEETGGAKTVTLDVTQIPAHTHIVTSQTATTGGATSYEHGVLDTSSAETEATEVTGSTGGGSAHPNLQPYIVVFIWKRTA